MGFVFCIILFRVLRIVCDVKFFEGMRLIKCF